MGLPEDDFKRAEKDVQKNTDDAVSKINEALAKRVRSSKSLKV